MSETMLKDACATTCSENSYNININSGQNESDPKILKCDICNLTFKRKYNLTLHKIKHEGSENLECNMCGNIFPKNRFLRHVMVHTGERPHVCNICGRGFRLNRDLKQHSFTHTGEKPYACDFCGRRFLDKSARRKHYQTHTVLMFGK
ncbi:zinc finger protein 2 homolog isoform X2 [Stegodyphus dumicola]|uniref:zinc finger protein 2 homolog isoform X2 n=1 Tax=Stegodyphus dumicola TaxID=202533 RepID=UPI0015AE9E77|nr:zinc finger protein 2 homolog isoform X2 [Stegodyphus dumicola]